MPDHLDNVARKHDLVLVRRALGLFNSMVRSGEPMTMQASETFDAALMALARLEPESNG